MNVLVSGNVLISGGLWNSAFRIATFWVITAGCVVVLGSIWPAFDAHLIADVLLKAFSGEMRGLSTQSFAFALASALVAVGGGLAVAFTLLHAVAVPLSLRSARQTIAGSRDMAAFSESYAIVYKQLTSHPLIGHAWKEFDETLVMPKEPGDVIRNTIRPQAFINIGVARDRLFGLKLMSSIPGYFVGIGLLLTFGGLVLALHKAAAATTSIDANAMQIATRELLQVATFKFSTSIAGLGMSILLSLLFRIYTIKMESAFNKFCQEVERKLRYTAPQSITAEMNEHMAEQLNELKQINSADFFARMGEAVSPKIETAFSTAIAPVTSSIDEAVKQLANNSQEGVSELIERFIKGVQGGAGTELRELAGTLKAMQAALLEVHGGLQGTGEDFGRRMSEAAENLNRLVSEAGKTLRDSSDESRTALLDVVAALRETFEQTSRNVDQGLRQAAAGASERVEEAMVRVLERLEGQIDSFRSGLGGFQEAMAGQIDDTRKTVASAQVSATNAIAGASAEAAKALQSGIADVMSQINGELERFTTAMQSTGTALAEQAKSVREASTESRTVAEAFSQTAQNVQVAASPLIESGKRIADATERMTGLMGRSVVGLETGQQAAKQLAEALLGHMSQLSRTWESYSSKFERVDEDLSRAVSELGQATERQAQMLTDYAFKVDEGFAKAVTNLNPLLSGLNENTQCFGEAVEDLCGALRSRRAGEARASL